MSNLERRSFLLGLGGGALISSYQCGGERPASGPDASSSSLAQTPPMGWNSYQAYGSSVREDEFKANTDVLASRLSRFGWEYAVVDFCWSHPKPGSVSNPNLEETNGRLAPDLAMDEFGRLLPALQRFPSAASGDGFKTLSDYVHSKELKFGIHVMRGVPRQAVARKLPVKGAGVTADQIADTSSICPWLNHMYGVDMTKPGAQAYYDSLFQLYALWGVDYVKVDDISGPNRYYAAEIEAVAKAIKSCGRPMVLSLSPGAAPLEEVKHLRKHANLWRISNDFWDEWEQLEEQFELCAEWAPHIVPGGWPDADILPLGRLCIRGPDPEERQTSFTRPEQTTLLTLWSICRSPLMIGSDLPSLDDWTLSLLTNEEVLAVNQASEANRRLFHRDDDVVWVANVPGDSGKYVALFNMSDDGPRQVSVKVEELGLTGSVQVRDLWQRKDLGPAEDMLSAELPAHGAALLRVSPG